MLIMSNVYGLIGEKLGHSLSPEIHSLILDKLNKKGLYNLFEIKKENIGTALNGLRAIEAKGVNVTIPYKIDVIKYMDKLSQEAKKIGAVNTISFNDNLLTGYNTDYLGFGASLKKAEIEIENKKIIILGTGGASRAVIQYLIDNNAGEIINVSRNPGAKTGYERSIRIITYNEMEKLSEADIIINATPLGMYPNINVSPVSNEIISHFKAAVDLIYNPRETLFLKSASNLGLKTLNGLYMLVSQAIAAQEIWNGISINDEAVDDIYHMIESKFMP